MNYDLMNGDMMEREGVECKFPSKTKRGDLIRVRKRLKCCPFGVSEGKVIEPGLYKVVSRKHFVAGYHTITEA